MRTVHIKMTKAASARLSLLRTPEALPIPLDMESMHPFGFRFNGPMMVVTAQGRDVAYVQDHREDALRVLTPITPDDRVDTGLRRFFARITDDLTRASRVMNAERRERTALVNEEKTRRHDGKIADAIAAFSPFFTHDPERWTATFEPHALRLAEKVRSPADVIQVCRIDSRYFIFIADHHVHVEISSPRHGGAFSVKSVDGSNFDSRIMEALSNFSDAGHKPDLVKISADVNRMRDRALRVQDVNNVIRALQGIPDSEYSFELFLMNTPADITGATLNLENDVVLEISANRLLITQEGVNRNTYAFDSSQRILTSPRACFYEIDLSDIDTHMTEPAWQRLGSFIVAALAAANPDHNFDIFKVLDADDLAIGAAATDAGYTF